jgi:hypothetical protein
MRHRWECRCKPRNDLAVSTSYQTYCRWGQCLEWRCNDCHATLGGFGTIGCKCDGYIREWVHPDMRQQEHPAPVKPSKLARRNRKPRQRERLTK